MGDPGALAASSLASITDPEESTILEFLRNKPNQRAEILKYIGMTKGKKKVPVPCPSAPTSNVPGFFLLSSLTNTTTASNKNPFLQPQPTINSPQPMGGVKRLRSPEIATAPQPPQFQAQNQQAPKPTEPGDKRLTVILGSSLPVALKKDRKELIAAVKFAAPAGVNLGEIGLTKNEDILISCHTPHDHNACLRTDKWTQIPHTFVPRFNLSASNNDIVYIKSVPFEMDVTAFDDLLKGKNINYSNLERVKTGKNRSESLTLRLLIHDRRQKEKLVKEGLLIDHKKFKLETHVKSTVKQCFRCLDYGHLVADCTGSQSCTRCGGPHQHRECTVDRDSPTCANCSKDDNISVEERKHAASDRGCPTRIRLLREARRLGLKNPNPTSSTTTGQNSKAPAFSTSTDFPALPTVGGLGFSAVVGGAARPVPATASTYSSNRIFNEQIIDPRILDQAAAERQEIVTTILGIVADALDEILHEIPSVSRKKIGDSLLRSVGRLGDKYIDIAAVARKVMQNPTNVTGGAPFQVPNTPSRVYQSQGMLPGWIPALSNQVIENALKRPSPAPMISQQVVNPPDPKRLNKRKSNLQGRQSRQRADSEPGSIFSETSTTSANCLNIHSTPTGQRLSNASGASPLLGRQSALSSPTSSILSSPGGSNYMSPLLSGEDSQMESDPEALNSILDSSLMKILQTTGQLQSIPASAVGTAGQIKNPLTPATLAAAASTPTAAPATNQPAQKPVANANRKAKKKNLMEDSRLDG